ncbi:6-phosphofructokinase [Prolixibacteraceae bacterium JC049]|nr:6-phosphofructokinase [Prolixibacteraceae bacterium JC049]
MAEIPNIKKRGEIKRIGVLTSGGDAPGMNPAIRAVTRSGIHKGLEVFGVMNGYQGMIEGNIVPLTSDDVSGILQKGGTILKTARSKDFRTEEGRAKAYKNLMKLEIDALVVIGGDGSFMGASIFSKEYDIPVVGIPGTIDNDMYGTEYTLGYDTAMNTVIDAVDKIKDTASSHGRIFFVEVMGREAGLLALSSGIACGAEAIIIPEADEGDKDLQKYLKNYKKKKNSGIVMVAEGDKAGGALKLAERVTSDYPDLDVRVSILGHMQRGGNPTGTDRVIATQMGVAAVEALLDDQKSIMIGYVNSKITHVPFNKTVKANRPIDHDLLDIQKALNKW